MPDSTMTPQETQAMLTSGAKLVDSWPLLLDAIEGIVAQTVARGFTPDQARQIVASVFSQGQRQ